MTIPHETLPGENSFDEIFAAAAQSLPTKSLHPFTRLSSCSKIALLFMLDVVLPALGGLRARGMKRTPATPQNHCVETQKKCIRSDSPGFSARSHSLPH